MPQAKVTIKKKQPTQVKKTVTPSQYQPVFDLYRDGLTQGAISLFLSCREQFRLGKVFGWRPKAKSDSTAFGSAFHDVLASVQHSDHGKPLKLDQALEKHRKSLITPSLTAKQTEDIDLMLALIKVYIPLYLERWKKRNDSLEWVEREKTFDFIYELQLNGKELTHDIHLRGRRDGACRKSNGLWLHETKTKSRIDEEGMPMYLPHDTQTMLYSLSLQRDYQEIPRGTVYDVIRTTSLQLRKGRGKAAVPESLTAYVDRVKQDIQDNMDWYFMQYDVTLTQKDLFNWRNGFLEPVLNQVVNWWESVKDNLHNPWKSPLHYVNPQSLYGYYGRSYLFRAICSGQFFDLEQSKIVYPELID